MPLCAHLSHLAAVFILPHALHQAKHVLLLLLQAVVLFCFQQHNPANLNLPLPNLGAAVQLAVVLGAAGRADPGQLVVQSRGRGRAC